MRTLIYKRTHTGDPVKQGVFGCKGCMGRVRSWHFDAVIGIGGLGSEAEQEGIAYKVTWIGVGAHLRAVDWTQYPLVTFDHFRLFDEKGDDFRVVAPILARRIYKRGSRTAMKFTSAEQAEIDRLLLPAWDWPQSSTMLNRVKKAAPICRTKRKLVASCPIKSVLSHYS